jgi:ribosomal protein L29
MTEENKKLILVEIANLKKKLMMLRIKASSGESVVIKNYKNTKKDIARLFTKINKKS